VSIAIVTHFAHRRATRLSRSNGKSDCYLKVKLGGVTQSTRDRYLPETTEPEFYEVRAGASCGRAVHDTLQPPTIPRVFTLPPHAGV
jgi:hypothetical protein